MGLAALLLALGGLVLGLLPMLGGSAVWLLVLPVLGLPLSLCAAVLGVLARTQALRDGRRLPLCTVALALAVGSTLLCGAWTGLGLYASTRPARRPPVRHLIPAEPPAGDQPAPVGPHA